MGALCAGLSVDAQDGIGMTPLHYAAFSDAAEAAQVFIEGGKK